MNVKAKVKGKKRLCQGHIKSTDSIVILYKYQSKSTEMAKLHIVMAKIYIYMTITRFFFKKSY